MQVANNKMLHRPFIEEEFTLNHPEVIPSSGTYWAAVNFIPTEMKGTVNDLHSQPDFAAFVIPAYFVGRNTEHISVYAD